MSASPGERSNAALAKKAEAIEAQLEAALVAVRALKQSIAGRSPVFEAMQFFGELWCAKYQPGVADAKYHFTAKDGKEMKRLVNSDPRPDAIKQRIVRFFADTERFVLTNRHTFNIFVSKFNSYGSDIVAPTIVVPDRGVADCRHEPRCKSDLQHTQRRRADLRGVRT